jgi:pimeloyl-ACP methyl ester carboxylesterase
VGAWDLDTMSIPAGDGRLLEVVLAGPANGEALFCHHGTPGAAEMFDPHVDVGAERDFRHITYSRPGYGGSTRVKGRSVSSCAADVAAIADVLGYDRFYSVGSSGGAPHSIALAALLPDRVISAAAIACPAPVSAVGLDWTAGMAKENLAELAAVQGTDDELQAYLEGEARSMLASSQDDVAASLGDLVSDADRQAINGALGEFIVRETAHALSTGVWGWFDDDRAILGDWGFDLRGTHAPLHLWHGAHDQFVPIAHGAWLANQLKVELQLRPNEGHLSQSPSSYGKILDSLLVGGAA